MKLFNLFSKNTKEDKINNYGNYLCACMISGEIDGEEATKELLYYKNQLDEIKR